MAHLNKLAIRGIRSFDDKQISVIEFFSPVTVIVGHNGSGKTTVIECLKYATTGDQPPNTRGGAFVHDPKMANEKEVKAQVKLRFHAANGKRMLAVRNLSVTVKKNSGLTMKTLENILALADSDAEKGGKRGVISTKCAELDAEIPQLLGVSKSVLENVIFCHQEDSYWPLAEPSILKKKFDDIFEATRYTKALDSIKTLRKDRVSELKAEKERLEGLSREKGHADKLKTRISDVETEIAAKEIEYEDLQKRYDDIVLSNKNFYERSSKFREVFSRVESLEEQKIRLQRDYDQSKVDLSTELRDSTEELQNSLHNFQSNLERQKAVAKAEEGRKDALEEDLSEKQKTLSQLHSREGEMKSEAKVQEERIREREQKIHELATSFNIKGFNHSSLERAKIVEFTGILEDLKKGKKREYQDLEDDRDNTTKKYNEKLHELNKVVDSHTTRKEHLREQIALNRKEIIALERAVEDKGTLTMELSSVKAELRDKSNRLETLEDDYEKAKFDDRIAQKTAQMKSLTEQKDGLNSEFAALSSQADMRAKLDLKREEIRSKTAEIKTTLDVANKKFRKLIGTDANVDSIERDVEHAITEKEDERSELESSMNSANLAMQAAEASLDTSQNQLKSKQTEMKDCDRQLKSALDGDDDLLTSIGVAKKEVDHLKRGSYERTGNSAIFQRLLADGKENHKCPTCSQGLDSPKMKVFEKRLEEWIKKCSPESVKEDEDDLVAWQQELDRLEKLTSVQNTYDRLKKTEIPAIESEIRDLESKLPAMREKTHEATESVETIKRELNDLSSLKQLAAPISRLQKEIDRARADVNSYEKDLTETGSSRTMDDLQAEIEQLSNEIRAADREKTQLLTEKQRQGQAMQRVRTEVHGLEKAEMEKQHSLTTKESSEKHLEVLKTNNATFAMQIKDLDARIAESQAPIDALKIEYQGNLTNLSSKISQAQTEIQDLTSQTDKLSRTHKDIERYVKDKSAVKLQECTQRIAAMREEMKQMTVDLDNARKLIAKIDNENASAGSTMANIRENLRLRKILSDIQNIDDDINGYDMEEAARAKRKFETEYGPLKAKENDLHGKVGFLNGELSSSKSQLATWQKDLKEFKDIYKRYTDQLVKVKMSDMANNDLEKYAKALENAILKYHGLKMEEVNDTMRHLWNKTYQGTDIDGIKIRSDVEGGTTKRSYNYRVVMTKDQVEMDMRGRCSAGQKMLASIIIRLALSDSFGQNCGILALDEPTNALDTENIDALASSLVDIINERKGHSNFQLIIITHDENFLRKLGQSDVMEYYWRVSRDARQKSVIERQRFR